MPVACHSCPVLDGECILTPPGASDPRVAPWMEHLKSIGVIDADGKMLKPGACMMRGVGPKGYLWRLSWED